MSPHSDTLQPTPLTSWGGFIGQRRLSDSPFIESIWEGVAGHGGVHTTAADGAIDLTFQKRQGVTRLLLSGPTSKAYVTTFEPEDEVISIRLRPGVHLPFMVGAKLTDHDMFLPNAGSRYFWLHSSAIPFPNFDNTETFIERLAKKHLLERDVVIEDVLANKSRRVSLRTVQRHFFAVTGLTMSHVRQIKRAEVARNLLYSGHTLTSIAYEAGYSNPGHMTNSFKYFFGQTPTKLRALVTS